MLKKSKDVTIWTRISPELAEAIRVRAVAENRTISGQIREILGKELAKKVSKAAKTA